MCIRDSSRGKPVPCPRCSGQSPQSGPPRPGACGQGAPSGGASAHEAGLGRAPSTGALPPPAPESR
eukprot:6746091-Alexandrium_andersonii.AAC.1